MKKVIIAILAAVCFIGILSCSKSIEDKAASLAEQKIKETLYFPDSYDMASIKVDSVIAPFDGPEILDMMMEGGVYNEKYQSAQYQMESARSSMSLWSDQYSEFSRNEYRQAKQKYEMAENDLYSIEESIQDWLARLESMLAQDEEVVGYKAYVTYRAKNNSGQTLMSGSLFFFDKEITHVVAEYPVSYDEYQDVMNAIEEIRSKKNMF